MATRKRKSAKRTGRHRVGAWQVAKAKRAVRQATVRARVRKTLGKPVPVLFGKTSTKRIRFKLPTGKWSRSYANRGAARRGARRIYKAKVVAQKVAA